jgi:hypothetical protein
MEQSLYACLIIQEYWEERVSKTWRRIGRVTKGRSVRQCFGTRLCAHRGQSFPCGNKEDNRCKNTVYDKYTRECSYWGWNRKRWYQESAIALSERMPDRSVPRGQAMNKS